MQEVEAKRLPVLQEGLDCKTGRRLGFQGFACLFFFLDAVYYFAEIPGFIRCRLLSSIYSSLLKLSLKFHSF